MNLITGRLCLCSQSTSDSWNGVVCPMAHLHQSERRVPFNQARYSKMILPCCKFAYMTVTIHLGYMYIYIHIIAVYTYIYIYDIYIYVYMYIYRTYCPDLIFGRKHIWFEIIGLLSEGTENDDNKYTMKSHHFSHRYQICMRI